MTVRFEAGDIICVSGKSVFKNLISWFSRAPGEEKTYAKHIAGVSDKNTITEALSTVKSTKTEEWMPLHKKFEVWRLRTLNKNKRRDIKEYVRNKEGSIYGGWKLFLFGGDFLLTKIFRKDVYLFRRIGFSERFPICSWLWAYAYDTINYRFDGKDPNYLDPDTMHDIIIKNEKWILVYKK